MKHHRGSKDWKMKHKKFLKSSSTNRKFWKKFANKHFRKTGDWAKYYHISAWCISQS